MRMRSLARRVGEYKKELAEKLISQKGQIVSVSQVRKTAEKIGYRFRGRRWPPWLTVLGFITQVLDQDQSCRAAVAKVWAWWAALGQEPPSSNTGPYCEARKRLPESLLSGLAQEKA